MNVNINSLTTKKSIFFETRDKNENLLQTRTNQSQTTKNFQQNKNRFQITTAQKSIQSLLTIQKQIRSLFDDNRNFIVGQSTLCMNDVKNISIYDFVNVFSKQNMTQKQSNFINMTDRNLNDRDRLFFDRIDRSQASENDRKKNFFFSHINVASCKVVYHRNKNRIHIWINFFKNKQFIISITKIVVILKTW